jgi:hypothetical protein
MLFLGVKKSCEYNNSQDFLFFDINVKRLFYIVSVVIKPAFKFIQNFKSSKKSKLIPSITIFVFVEFRLYKYK